MAQETTAGELLTHLMRKGSQRLLFFIKMIDALTFQERGRVSL